MGTYRYLCRILSFLPGRHRSHCVVKSFQQSFQLYHIWLYVVHLLNEKDFNGLRKFSLALMVNSIDFLNQILTSVNLISTGYRLLLWDSHEVAAGDQNPQDTCCATKDQVLTENPPKSNRIHSKFFKIRNSSSAIELTCYFRCVASVESNQKQSRNEE